MPIAPSNTYTGVPLLPFFDPEDALEFPVNIPPSTTIAKGTILGQFTSSANDVQTITMGTATGGSFTLSGTNPLSGQTFTTAAINVSGISTATIQAALVTVLGAGNVAVTGTYVVTLAGQLAGFPMALMTVNSSVTGGTAPTIAHTTTGRSAGTYGAYASGNSDGTQTAKAIMKFSVISDASGNISMAGTATGGEFGETRKDCPAYFSGTFKTTDLTGLDATAVSALGHLISGTAADGILRIG